MSLVKTFEQYLDVVKKGIQNKDQIIEAIKTASEIKNKTGEVSDEAIAEIMRRKDICANCPFNSKNAKEISGYKSFLPYEHCIHCLCRIGGNDTKEYCLSCKCGLTEYNKLHPDNPKELKWMPFEINNTENQNQ